MQQSLSLVKNVYEDKVDDRYVIRAMITRFGDLAVFVWDYSPSADTLIIWQGTNILEARKWLDNCRDASRC